MYSDPDQFNQYIVEKKEVGGTNQLPASKNAPQVDINLVTSNNVVCRQLNLTNGGAAASATDQISFGYGGNSTSFRHFIKTRHNDPQDLNNAMEFYVHKPSAGVGSTANALTLTSTNAVGINTSSPAYNLHVVASGATGFTNASDKKGLLITDSTAPRIILENLNAQSNSRLLTMSGDGNNFVVGILNDAGTAWTKQKILNLNLINYDATFAGHILPELTASKDLGTDTLRMRTLYTVDIGVTGNIYTNTTSAPLVFSQQNQERFRINASGQVAIKSQLIPQDNGAQDLGASGNRFRDIYATNTVIQTSDLNEKKDILPLNSSEWLSIVTKLHPVSYKWIKNESDRNHTGFISQQVCDDVGSELADRWGFYIKSTINIPQEVPLESFEQVGEKRKRDEAQDVDVGELLGEEEKKDGYEPVVEEVVEDVPLTVTKEVYGLRYTELIAPLVACVQELNKRILLQQEQIAQLATQIEELKQESAV